MSPFSLFRTKKHYLIECFTTENKIAAYLVNIGPRTYTTVVILIKTAILTTLLRFQNQTSIKCMFSGDYVS